MRELLSIAAFVWALSPVLAGTPASSRERSEPPADAILQSVGDESLRRVLQDVLDRNPDLASMAARAAAHEERPAQVRAFPDPQLAVTAFALSPETRVGPQQATISLSQRFPWFGKRDLRENVAIRDAGVARADLESMRLAVLTEARVAYYELAFLDAQADITRTDAETLRHYERLARSRYASGVGLQQGAIKLQAEITKDDSRLLDIARRRAAVVAVLNALRDRPADAAIDRVALPSPVELEWDRATLLGEALVRRPEAVAADAEVAREELKVELARKDYKPDVTLGLAYTMVGPRGDAAGRATPPPDNGEDIVGLTAGINLPVWRSRLSAGVREAIHRRTSAEEERRRIHAEIRRALDDLAARIPLTWSQSRLFEDVLIPQAEESLRSVESGYAAGTVGALDLLDAERVLLEARVAAARTSADYAIALARLDGAVGAAASRVLERRQDGR